MSKKIIRLTESELVRLVKKLINEDEMMGSPKEYTLKDFGINETSYIADIRGMSCPFMVGGVEVKRSRDMKPNEKFSMRDGTIDFVTNKTKKNFTISFQNGNAKLRK